MKPQKLSNSGFFPQQPATICEQDYVQSLPVNRRFRSTVGLTAAGILMTALGGMGVFVFGILEIFGFVTALAFDAAGVAVAALFGVCLAASAVLLGFGVRNLVTASHVKSFRRVFGNHEILTFDFLAAHLHATPAKTLSRTRKLLKRGYIVQGHIDDQNTMLMVTEAAYRQYTQAQEAHYLNLEQQRALQEAQATQEAQRLEREKELADRLTAQQHEFVLQVRDYLKRLRTLDERIDDAAVSEHIVAIEDVVKRILERAEEEPSVIAGLSTLTSYYLPTVVNLLDAYDTMEDESVQGHTISTSRRDIESTLKVTRDAFEKLLDATYQDLSLDVSADISVLHAMLAREGLTENPFDTKG